MKLHFGEVDPIVTINLPLSLLINESSADTLINLVHSDLDQASSNDW